MSPAVRRMRWWDLAAAADLERRLFPDDPWTVEQFWSELAGVPHTRYYVVADSPAVPEPDLVGYAGLLVGLDAAEVQTLAVAPEQQGRGLGRALLRELLGEAQRRGAPEVLLEVRVDDPVAGALYASEGFERVAVRRGYYRRGRLDALVLRRRA